MDYWHGAGVCVNRAGVYFFARQEWSATAIADRPTVNMLGGYYSQQQFLRNLDVRSETWLLPTNHRLWTKLIKSLLCNWPRGIPAESSGCKPTITNSRMVGNSKADAALLDEMINNIVFIPVTLPARSMTA